MPSVRTEIQALRAVAVALVVVHHLWPGALPGGFVGVDVFFVVSGYLITGLLLRELERSGRISLPRFWMRRIRRILPAALLVLAVCTLATLLVVPSVYWEQYLAEITASTGYVQNWHLAGAAVDYFRAEEAPSPVRHFWSLSVEEQFYLCWPLLLLIAGRARRVAIAAVTLASFAWSVRLTGSDPAAAYFVTPTRAWELGAGGLLAMAPAARRSPLLGWAGLAAIGVSAALFSESTPFPGAAALLPVLGALAVIAAGAPVRGMEARAVQAVGGASYAIYLWHWPLIVLAPFVLTSTPRGVLLVLTILLALLTKLLVEDPARFGRLASPQALLPMVGSATAAVLALCAGGTAHIRGEVQRAERASARVIASRPACFGAAARDPRHPCSNPRLRRSVVPTPLQARNRSNAPCTLRERTGLLYVCAFGAPRGGASRTIALIGDSHASHWRAALAPAARDLAWTGVSIAHSGCPFTRAVKELREPDRSECLRWNREVLRWLARHREISTIFVSAISGSDWVRTPGRSEYATAVSGYAAAWAALPPSVERVVVLRDTPKAALATAPCVERAIADHRPAGPRCALLRRTAIVADPAATAAARYRSDRAVVVDLNRFICGPRTCLPVVGGALVYKDEHHMTAVFAATLAPYLERAIARVAG